MKSSEKQDSLTRMTLRLPPAIYDEIRSAAEKNGQTMSAEIISRIHTSPVAEQLAAQAREMAEMKQLIRELLDR